jgi:copper resistance protein B
MTRDRLVFVVVLTALVAWSVACVTVLVEDRFAEFVDSAIYMLTAKSLVAGEGYSYLGSPFFVRPPGTSALIAPYKFDVDAALFLSTEGDVTARAELEYDLLLTQRLILQPRFEINAALSDDREIGIASGINTTELGLRLRYEFRRQFAPYLGVSWQQSYAGSADLARAAGTPTSRTSFVAGVRFWF